jgi:hypothetical protein
VDPDFRRMILDRDEVGFEQAFFEGDCPHCFIVDGRDDDADIIQSCSKCLSLPSLSGEWQGDDLIITYGNETKRVPIQFDIGDRHTTVCALNDILSPTFEVRYLVISHGSDTLGFAALSTEDWASLKTANREAVAENFIDPRTLPNIMTELTDETLPPDARARSERLVERNRM